MRMNKLLKSFFCILLSLVTWLSVGMLAFADTSLTITIKPGEGDAAKHTYEAYQVFKGTVYNDEAANKTYLGNIEWGSGVKGDDLLAALKEATDDVFQEDNVNVFSTRTSASDVAEILEKHFYDVDFVNAFAQIVSENLTADKSDIFESSESDGKYVIDVTKTPDNSGGEGYYFVKDSDEVNLNEKEGAYTRFILEVVKSVTVQAKTEVPSIDKVIVDSPQSDAKDGKKVNTASIGDKITYMLTSNVPDMTGYNKYFFIITDQMEKGLTFNDDVLIVIDGGKYHLTADAYSVTTETITSQDSYNGGTKIEIVFKDFLELYKENQGDSITVTYSATLNENAELSSNGNKNKVDLLFSNNPHFNYQGDKDSEGRPGTGEPIGKTPEKEVKTFTTGIQIIKVDGSNKNAPLTGARFRLSGDGVKAILTNEKIYIEDKNGTYYLLKNGGYTEEQPTEDTSDKYVHPSGEKKYKYVEKVDQYTVSDTVDYDIEAYVDGAGYLIFEGLAAGTYTIEELEAPKGYNSLGKIIEVTVKAILDQDKQTCNWDVSYNYEDSTTKEKMNPTNDGLLYKLQIANYQGILLPGAGGMGTTIIYILGVVFVVAAGVVFFLSRRKDEKK